MKTLNEFTYACSPLRFKPDVRMLAAGCFQMTTEVEDLVKPGTQIGNNVRVWYVFSGKEIPMVQKQNGSVQDRWQALAFSPDGKTMSAVSGSGGQIWSLTTTATTTAAAAAASTTGPACGAASPSRPT